MMELLAPAGNRDNLIAAIQAGADAVYLGASLFSARAYAGNFTEEELTWALDYVHGYGGKVYLTVNTLLKDEELHDAINLCISAWNLGVDALIFQDPGLLYLLKELYPDIELHVSTQLSIHNSLQGEYFKEKGVERLILARELSLNEIKEMAKVGLDLEVFVQGALCICYSGQCLMSSLIGGRSGNRGRCAQPCRLAYGLYKEEEKIKAAHLLSPKDLSLLHELEQLKEAGVKSLKLEGRMRSASYVYQAVSSYRNALDHGVVDDDKMKQAFNRQGFTRGYLCKKGGEDLMATEAPGKGGLDLGLVRGKKIQLLRGLRLQDGIATRKGGFRVEKILLQKKEVKEAKQGELVEIFPRDYEDGEMLKKNVDISLEEEIKEVLHRPFEKKENIDVDFIFKVGEAMELGGIKGDIVQAALKAPLSKERVLENLEKRGDSPIKLKPIIKEFEEGFVPMKSLNALRREVIEAKLQARLNRRDLKEKSLPAFYKEASLAEKFVIFREKKYLQWDFSGMEVVADPFFKEEGCIRFSDLGEYRDYYLRVPGIVKENVEKLCRKILSLKGLKGVLTSNQGVMRALSGRLPLLGDYKLNLMNSYGLALYNELEGSLVSEELGKRELAGLKNKDAFMIYVYGPQEMMVLEHCLTKKEGPCSCDHRPHYLQDQKGYRLRLARDIYCRNHLYNGPVKNLLGEISELRRLGFGSFVVELFDEAQAEKVLEAFREEKGLEIPLSTRGHYHRGVE